MIKKYIPKSVYQFILFTLLCQVNLSAQSTNAYRVYLKDKGSSLEKLKDPLSFLSQAAIDRRALQGIPIEVSDLPPALEYKRALEARGGNVLAQSRWLNYYYVSNLTEQQIAEYPFVKRIEKIQQHQGGVAKLEFLDSLKYGFSKGQVAMLNGDKLHLRGFTGHGINIAVIDAGFAGTLQAAALDSLRNSGRLLGSHNFINPNMSVYDNSFGSHGTSVLSIMAANHPDTMIGSAPHANYWLLSSEDISQENPLEMDYWLMAAEFADSVGVHLINTSISYTIFDNSQASFSYADMDGNTTLITKAADWAASKGIIVVASAGNYGSTAWQYLGAPADGDSVLAVGAVSWNQDYALFSSLGPSADGRIKPDVVAQGSPTTVLDASGQVNIDFGTSFSSPIVAGLAACLIEAYPAKHGEEIAQLIRASSHLYSQPNDSLGYGIPNFEQAFYLSQNRLVVSEEQLSIYPNPIKSFIIIDAKSRKNWQAQVRVFNLQGQRLMDKAITAFDALRLELNLEPGVYELEIKGDINARTKIWVGN